ncbi:cobalt-precorrin 3 C17-methyltransferase CbiH (plasmid) [Peptoclostridium acidaminophilum DSM 3953]|uniref:Cobalt-precorrin 3 C17-methyltransferase CbiH n=1 Tax=Peptoclostridium acidaminophilum DSM 3953 TaxID=1286171 RepID=W8TN52_PEPAC|nr:precorrin-3B C(17)-methyltransferase [Peptoclostridium acidaminophilum]AHM57612.1 cobalt-precorrin 3 C17-methyltransferase CbiH [Peptoclostridium acidaminophilum DSM 3953]
MNEGKIFVVGIGPGGREHMTGAAIEAIGRSDAVIGYKTYIELIEDMLLDKEILGYGMKREVERCRAALELAEKGRTVALVSSGDCGVYGMAGIMLEIAAESGCESDIEIVPGVPAANSAAACLGAPLMHDYATISLSDLLTDWSAIEKRLDCAAQADFVICLYNPRSHGRREHIEKARNIIMKHRAEGTPVGIVRSAMREGQFATVTTLGEMLSHDIDMLTTVIIGNSKTYASELGIITPRGYKR